jgi:hypothetical protein
MDVRTPAGRARKHTMLRGTSASRVQLGGSVDTVGQVPRQPQVPFDHLAVTVSSIGAERRPDRKRAGATRILGRDKTDVAAQIHQLYCSGTAHRPSRPAGTTTPCPDSSAGGIYPSLRGKRACRGRSLKTPRTTRSEWRPRATSGRHVAAANDQSARRDQCSGCATRLTFTRGRRIGSCGGVQNSASSSSICSDSVCAWAIQSIIAGCASIVSR